MEDLTINRNLIDYFRKTYFTINHIDLGNNRDDLIPENLQHLHLIVNNSIDESIYRYYHFPTRGMISQAEFEEIESKGSATKETLIKPYNILFYGAFHFLPNFITKLESIAFLQNKPKIKGQSVKDLFDLNPYFNEYASGFKDGFNDFESNEIKPFLTMVSDKGDYFKRVFEYVTKSIPFSHSWSSLRTGFVLDGLNNYEIVDAYGDGKKEGYFYRAWSIILSNNNYFAPYFREYFKDKNIKLEYDFKAQSKQIEIQEVEKRNQIKDDVSNKSLNIGDVRTYITQTFSELDRGFLQELHLPDFYDNIQIISKSFDVEYLTTNINTGKWKIYLQSLRNDIEKYKSSNNEMLQILHNHICLQLESIELGILNIESIENDSKETKKQFSTKLGKYTAKEYALAYIFDLWAKGEQIPFNRIEGGLSKKELHEIGNRIPTIKNDTFYRAVKLLTSYDLNKHTQLQSISQDWQNAVQKLSKNWALTKEYLIQKELFRE